MAIRENILQFHTLEDLHSFSSTMRASGHSLTSLRLGPTPGDAYDWEDLHAQEQQHAEQHSHAEQQRHALGQHERISPVFLQHYPQLQQLHLERANWNLSSLNPSWLTALRTLTVHHSHCTASDFEFLAHITPQLQELSLYVLNQGGCTLNFSFSAAQSIHLVLDRHSVHLNLALPASLKSLSVSADSLDLECHSDPPLSLDFLMLIGRKRLVVSSLPLASAKDVYLNAPSMHEESFDPLTNPPCPLQSSPSHHFKSRELYASSVSESSLIRVLQSVAPTVEALMVPHSLPIEAVEGEWRALHRLAIGVRGSKAGRGRCRTTVEAAEARAGFISRLYPRHGAGGERGDRGSGRGDNSSSSSSSSRRCSRKREAPRPPFIDAPALRSLLFATRRCNSDTLVSLQEDFPSLEIYCIIGRSFCWKPIGSERLSQPIVCVSAHRTAANSNAPRFETAEGSSGEMDVGGFMDGLQCL